MPNDDSRAPYFEAVCTHLSQEVLSFHVPGHQGGLGLAPEFANALGVGAFKADITEVLGIDDLHRPHGQLGQAQRLAAKAFGAEETHFLVNGSTAGNQAMLLACTRPGDLVLLPRNAHRSVWSGLILSGATAATYLPEFDPQLGVYSVPSLAIIEENLTRHPKATAVLLTSPSYHGHACDIEAAVQTVQRHGKLAFVDEAWGAHLGFHPGFPTSAVQAGADLVVQSAHKMLPSLTQSALLHRNGQRVDRQRLDTALRLLQTSSPSALLLTSIDAARRHYALHGEEILGELARIATRAQLALEKIEGIFCRGAELATPGKVPPLWDPTHLVVSALDRGYTGYELEAQLRHEHGQQVEMSDLFGVVLVLTAGHTEEHLERFVSAIESLPQRQPRAVDSAPVEFIPSTFTPRQAFMAKRKQVPAAEAVGKISAETVTLYPPGIPWILPGERIEAPLLSELRHRQKAGGQIQGAWDPSLTTLGVCDE